MAKIILASQSARRKQILEWAEIPLIVIPANTEENIPEGLTPEEVTIAIAREKAVEVKERLKKHEEGRTMPHHSLPILAADTIVVLKNKIIGKPINRNNAIEILQQLSGNQHQVITGVFIFYEEKELSFYDTTNVYFNELSLEQIEYYVDNYKPYDKAGAYAIQEWIGVVGIKKIIGDFYNVMGLPVSRVLKALQEVGY